MDTSKMKIAVVFEGDLQGGGGYQYQLSALVELQRTLQYHFVAFVFSKKNQEVVQQYSIETVYCKQTLFDTAFRYINRQEWFYIFSSFFKFKCHFEKKLDSYNIDIVYFLSPSRYSLDLVTHNYILTVWDLCHRDHVEFPEVNYYREFEKREQFFMRSLKKAVAILTDSSLSKENILRRYGIDEQRVYFSSFTPSISVVSGRHTDVRKKYKITGDYIYYPAQFWSHKNHTYIIDALAILKQKGFIISAFFSGSDKGNLNFILDYADEKKVREQIVYAGFVPSEDLYGLYQDSLALVMPTYFGPTNIPPLEAFFVGTPVLYGDILGAKEQLGEAAFLCDLNNPFALVEKIIALQTNKDFAIEMIERGKVQLEKLLHNDLAHVLESVFETFYQRLKCWKV